MASLSFLVIFLLSLSLSHPHLLLSSSTEDQGKPPSPLSCRSLGCKKLRWIPSLLDESKPGCEFFREVNCKYDVTPWINLDGRVGWGGRPYQLKSSSRAASGEEDTIVIQDDWLRWELEHDRCEHIDHLSLPGPDDPAAPVYFKRVANSLTELITLYKCPLNLSIDHPLANYTHRCSDIIIYYDLKNRTSAPPPDGCYTIHDYPVNKSIALDHLVPLLTSDITLEVHVSPQCLRCPSNGSTHCQDNDHPPEFQCLDEHDHKKNGGKKVGLAIGLAVSVIGIGILMVLSFYFGEKLTSIFGKKRRGKHPNIEAFLRNHGSLAPKRYRYSEVKRMTRSFRDRVGEGGYGVVYKGKLLNGDLVAVKLLKETEGSGEELINEIASISRTSHVNIVSLLGFCFEGPKRALIYEFMPNGSLEKYVSNGNPSQTSCQLGWETLYKIAVGIARGLEYLHRGCHTRILHFDIKPRNILLGEDFCPKISDFGLAKLCTRKDSIISMLGMKGTPGYIAPEVFCRTFGGVSHKSDVYSYGMMVLDMVGGRMEVDGGSSNHSSEVYFPDSIYKFIEEDVGGGELMDEERECRRRLVLVGLWCIQTRPSDRPAMCQVLDMLEGRLGSLEIPPKPVLFSPPRPLIDSSSTTMS